MRNQHYEKKIQKMNVDHTSFPVYVTFATLYYSAFIFVASSIVYIYSNILNITGSVSYLLQANGNIFLVDHLATVFKISTSAPKSAQNIILMFIFLVSMLIVLALIESGFYGFVLSASGEANDSFLDSIKKYWKKILLFLICLSPVFILSGLSGFFVEFLLLKTGLSSILAKVISYILMSSLLIPFIPARFYYLNGSSFRESIIFSLENFSKYVTSTFPIIIPVGVLVLIISNTISSNPNSVLTIISYSPVIVILGIVSWFFYAISISKVAKKYIELNKGGDFD